VGRGIRMTRLSSAKYLRGSKGQRCTIRITDVCAGDTETVIAAHIRDRHTGRGIKASDISVANCCWACHERLDGRAKMPDGFLITDQDWLFYALRGLQETLEQRIEAGLLIFPHDAPEERVPKPRKPKSERKAINSRPFPKQSRGWRKKEE
jgi:hypothetical protein